MKSIPLLIIPFALYNALVVANIDFLLADSLSLSGNFSITGGGLILLLAVVLLCFDIIKAAVYGRGLVVEQILSIVLLLMGFLQIVVWAPA